MIYCIKKSYCSLLAFTRAGLPDAYDKNNGIQNRRDAEGALLASYNSPTYTKPHESPDSAKLTTAELNNSPYAKIEKFAKIL